RLSVPAWSSLPHLPQLESSVIQRSTSALVKLRGYFSAAAIGLAMNDPAAAASHPRRVIGNGSIVLLVRDTDCTPETSSPNRPVILFRHRATDSSLPLRILMRFHFRWLGIIAVAALAPALAQQASTEIIAERSFAERCAACHGNDATG